MKLKIFSYLSIISFLVSILLVINAAASMAEFDRLFTLEYQQERLILNRNEGIKLPDSNLNSWQRLYRHVGLFSKLELYLINEDKTLVIVPYNRRQLYYCATVLIMLLHEADGKHFIFASNDNLNTTCKQICTSSNNSMITVEIERHRIPIKQFLAHDTTIKYLIDALEYGLADLPCQIYFAKLWQPTYACDSLITVDYQEEHILPCLFKAKGLSIERCFLLTELLACDVADYMYKTYNYLIDYAKSCRDKWQAKPKQD